MLNTWMTIYSEKFIDVTAGHVLMIPAQGDSISRLGWATRQDLSSKNKQAKNKTVFFYFIYVTLFIGWAEKDFMYNGCTSSWYFKITNGFNCFKYCL